MCDGVRQGLGRAGAEQYQGLDRGVPVGGPEPGLPSGALKAGVCHDQVYTLETE